MNQKIVGIVESVSGMVVKKNVILGQEQELKKGDFLSLDDSIWVRSLDAKATLQMHKTKINLNVGMRIKLDEDFLKQNNTFEFFTKEEIKNLSSQSNDSLTISLEPNLKVNDSFFIDAINLKSESWTETYDSLQIDYKFSSYSDKLFLKFISEHELIIKAYLVGNSGYILEKPVELLSKAVRKDDNIYLLIANKFIKSDVYLLYLNILNIKNENAFKEVFCEIDVQI